MKWQDRHPDSKVSYKELVYISQLFSQRIMPLFTSPSPSHGFPSHGFIVELLVIIDSANSLIAARCIPHGTTLYSLLPWSRHPRALWIQTEHSRGLNCPLKGTSLLSWTCFPTGLQLFLSKPALESPTWPCGDQLLLSSHEQTR